MKNPVILFLTFLLLNFLGPKLYAQSNPGFSFAKAEMTDAITKYLKAHPKQIQYYRYSKTERASFIDFPSLNKAYDLNPNDLSLKAGKHLSNTFLLVVPLAKPIKVADRLKSDRMNIPKVQKALALEGIFPSRNLLAAFILKPNGRGGYEIRE